MKKRIFNLLIVMSMVVGMLPTGVYAAETTQKVEVSDKTDTNIQKEDKKEKTETQNPETEKNETEKPEGEPKEEQPKEEQPKEEQPKEEQSETKPEETDKKEIECPKDSTCPLSKFSDLNISAWYHDGVHFCLEKGFMSGYENGTFKPDEYTSRAMVVSILWHMEGCPVVNYDMKFKDVKEGNWYLEAIRWASAEKVVNGYDENYFGPDDLVTREQMVLILWNYSKHKGYDVTVKDESAIAGVDFGDISNWMMPAMKWACSKDIISGMEDGSLNPKGYATRTQTAVILNNFLK